MDSENVTKDENIEIKRNKLNVNLESIKSNHILSRIYKNINEKKLLQLVKYNKKIQNRLNLGTKNYKEYCEIEIEIVPFEDKCGQFININEDNKMYYHIYLNDNKEEIKNKYSINKDDKVQKIKIIIDYQVQSFEKLFICCRCIKTINFKKFYRDNITCMSCMFDGCSSLKELNMSNFNTANVTNMREMFFEVSSLKEIKVSNFNTKEVTDMSFMFSGCSSLNKLNVSNFNTNKVIDMSCMFSRCSSLNELDISNFNTSQVNDMSCMFYRCSNDLKNKIISENKNIKNEAFY